MWKKIKKFLNILGPGVITGAADDDPSGIATYSQAGAQFGFGALWMNFYLLPLQATVQESCARIGAVTGMGITAVVKKYYSSRLMYMLVTLLVIANTINIGADIGAMAEAINLIIPVNFTISMLLVTAVILTLEIFTSYKVYSRILKWLASTLFVYLLTLLLVSRGQWGDLLTYTFIPSWELSFSYFFIFVGVCGTTISPYMFFWQAAEEIEEEKEAHLFRFGKPFITKKFIHHLRTDNLVGMAMSAVAAWSIVAVAAIVLSRSGVTDIRTAADAAKALEPLVGGFANAGFLAKVLFAGGIISLGLLAVPVLSGSAAYAIAEMWNMREGLNLKLNRAHGFYGAITLATLVGLIINYLGIDPMKMLIYTAVINGVVAVPLLAIIARIARDERIMGKWKSGWWSTAILYLTLIVMGVGTVGTIWYSYFA